MDTSTIDPARLELPAPVTTATARLARLPRPLTRVARSGRRALGWLVGLAMLVVGLSVLAALPVVQLVTLGYFLEASARVARSGRLRDGLIGVRRAGQIGRFALGFGLSLLPVLLIRSFADSAAWIDPGGRVAAAWRLGLTLAVALTMGHLALACLRGGRLRHFLWPFGNPRWLIRQLRAGGLYGRSRDAFWDALGALRLPYLFRVGAVGFLGTLAWLVLPAGMIALGGRFPLLFLTGFLALVLVVPLLPFLQVHYAVAGHWRALFDRQAARAAFQRAPWAFAAALMALLLAAIPLYLLKIEMIPREAAWLPSLVFVLFLLPARLLTGWAYARSLRQPQPRHWVGRALGRLAIVPVTLLYALVVFFAQYTSWGGASSVFEQHAFLVPVPFLNM